jgi:hypothetical protein
MCVAVVGKKGKEINTLASGNLEKIYRNKIVISAGELE